MCTGLEPALIASLLSAAAGSGVAAYGAKMTADEAAQNAEREAAASNKQLDLVRRANDPLAQQSREVFDRRVEQDIPRRQAEVTEDRTAGIMEAAESAPQADIPISGSAPEVVKTEVAKRMLDAMESGKARAKSLGKLGGYGDTWFDQGLQTGAAGRDMSTINDSISGNLSMLPFAQQYAAYGAYKPASGLGSVLQGAGNFAAAAAPTIGQKVAGVRKPAQGIIF